MRARYGAELPPFISIVRYPGRPVILGQGILNWPSPSAKMCRGFLVVLNRYTKRPLQDSAILFSTFGMGESAFYCANHRVSCKCHQPPGWLTFAGFSAGKFHLLYLVVVPESLNKFWRILPGIFVEDFSGHFFPQK